MTDLSAAEIGMHNYSAKVNMRRTMDVEQRREGYLPFSPLPTIPNQSVFDDTDACIRLAELVRPNGERAIVGFSRTEVKRFNTTTGAWDVIGSGYSAQGKRWQVETCNGYLIANNQVDLPFTWRVEDATVTPIHELREVGIASVGRITIYNSFLVCADIVEIQAEVMPLWMRGFSSFPISTTNARNANFTIPNADTTEEFDVTTGASNIVATLPSSPNANVYFWITKVDGGSGTVTTSPVVGVQPVVLDSINDTALVYRDTANDRWVAVVFSGGVIPADAPYGIVPSYLTNHLPWAVINSEYGEPRNWAPIFSVYMTASSATLTLPFASTAFVAGQTRVAVVNGGPDNGTLGGQEGYESGVLVTAVSGRQITLEIPTDVDLTYPRTVQVTRWEDVSTLSGRYELQDDNSGITGLTVLRDWLVVTRKTGIFLGRYTGNPSAPFTFTPKYRGSNVPLWGDAIAVIKGDYLLYPARGNRMVRFDGVTWPEIHEITDVSSTLFFDGVDEDTEVFAADNPITKEWFWHLPDTTIAFDYEQSTLSVFDAAFDAFAAIHKPGSYDEWCIGAQGRFIKTYGLAYGGDPFQTFLRDGEPVEGLIRWGLNWFGDEANEKMMWSHTPLFASQSPAAAVEVQLYGTHNPNAPQTALLTPPELLPSPDGRNFVPTAFQYLYFCDELTVVTEEDEDCRITGRIIEVELVKAAGVTRSVPYP